MNWKDRIQGQRAWIVISMLLLIVYLSPHIFFPDNAQHMIHDNLDSNVVWYKNLAESGHMFGSGDAEIEMTLGGIERKYYPTEYNVMYLGYYLFSPQVAYNLNIVLLHLIAFLGAFLILRHHVFKEHRDHWMIPVLSLSYAILPFWPSGGLTVAGQPLLLWAFLNLYQKNAKWYDWLTILAFPFYSMLVLGNLFIVGAYFALIALHYLITKQGNIQVLFGFVLFGLATFAAEYRLFLVGLGSHDPFHRDVWTGEGREVNIFGVAGLSLKLFLKGQYHFFARVFPIIPLAVALGFYYLPKRFKKYALIGLAIGILFSVLSVIRDWNVIKPYTGFLYRVNPRFYSVLPILWYALFAISVYYLILKGRVQRIIAMSLTGLLIIIGFTGMFDSDYLGSGYLENTFARTLIKSQDEPGYSTFDEFYSVDMFNNVHQITGEDRVLSIGISPERLQFSKVKTLGGYYGLYPLSHCRSFNQVRNKEGEMCSNSLYMTTGDLKNNSEYPRLAKRMGASYVVSKHNVKHDHLKLIEKIDKQEKSIFVYQITVESIE